MRNTILIIISVASLSSLWAQPDWVNDLNPGDFEHNMSVIVSLIDDCNSEGDIIGVFSTDGNIRGISDPITTSDTFLITVFSPTSQGENLVFKLYDDESDASFDIENVGFTFERGATLGLSSPIVIPGSESVPPVSRCKNATVYLNDMGSVTITVSDIDDGSTDNCVLVSRVLDRMSFTCADLGDQTVTLTTEDSFGNKSSCEAVVTVVDTIKPTPSCTNPTIFMNESGVATLSLSDIDNGSFDNCGISSREISKTTFLKNESALQTVTLTLTDVVGLVATCDAQVTIINPFENDIVNCSDGVDNDDDGLVDCADPDCAKPSINGVSSIDPSPLSCSTTQANGSITISASGADVYSIDGGSTSTTNVDFENIVAGEYVAWVQNLETSCTDTENIILNNRFDPLWSVQGFDIAGPQKLCSDLRGVDFSIDLEEPFVNLSWSLGGNPVLSKNTGTSSKLDFMEVVDGHLVATVQGICLTVSDSVMISAASPDICAISNCQRDLFINDEITMLPGAPDVFRASSILSSNSKFMGNDRELTAGQELQFYPGFEVADNLNVIADIKPCDK